MAPTHTHDHHDHAPAAPGEGSPGLLTAVHAFLQAPSKELEDAMVTALSKAAFLAVVNYDPPLASGRQGRAEIPAGTTMHFRGKVDPEGKMLLAVYSDAEAVAKDLPGQPVQTTVLDAARLIEFATTPPHAGAVLNPAGPFLELRAAELRRIGAEAARAA